MVSTVTMIMLSWGPVSTLARGFFVTVLTVCTGVVILRSGAPLFSDDEVLLLRPPLEEVSPSRSASMRLPTVYGLFGKLLWFPLSDGNELLDTDAAVVTAALRHR
jgi:hypothetical protein